MRCPFCREDDNKVIDSRLTDDGTCVRRRRACNHCDQRFTTYERVESEEHIRVIKRDNGLELFDRQKIVRGLLIACEKRPVPSEAIEGMVNKMYQDFLAEGRREVPTTEIGKAVMKGLRELDEVAYVRFASVYREFKDIEDFMRELRGFIKDGHAPSSYRQA